MVKLVKETEVMRRRQVRSRREYLEKEVYCGTFCETGWERLR